MDLTLRLKALWLLHRAQARAMPAATVILRDQEWSQNLQRSRAGSHNPVICCEKNNVGIDVMHTPLPLGIFSKSS